jgi:hypothetical protein
MKKLETVNPRIVSFYDQNPAISFEAVNLIFIDLFDQLLTDVNSTMNASINSQILSTVYENSQKIGELDSSIKHLKETVNAMNVEIIHNIVTKFTDAKQNYINDLKTIVQHNTMEKIGPLLEKNNYQMIDKMSLIVHDVIPKNQSHAYQQIQESIRSFHKSISDDTRVLLKYIDNNSIKEYINNFEMKSTMMIQNLQQPFYSFISASEDRINANIANLKENASSTQLVQTKLISELTEILNKVRPTITANTQDKTGNPIIVLLNKLFSTAEVVNLNKSQFTSAIFSRTMSSSSSSLDNANVSSFLLKRPNKGKVLIQNIDIDRNVNMDEIKDFIQTLEDNNCNGIFLSQHSGFLNKPNFHIETHNKSVVVYVHNVEYCADKIKTAIDIIYHLYVKLRDFNGENDYEITIEKEILEDINKEYQAFILQKEGIMNVLKESQKKVFSQIEEFKFPALDKYLSTKFAAPIHKQGFKCDLCKVFNANNLKALAAHKRGCTRKNVNATNVTLHAMQTVPSI